MKSNVVKNNIHYFDPTRDVEIEMFDSEVFIFVHYLIEIMHVILNSFETTKKNTKNQFQSISVYGIFCQISFLTES